MKKIILGVLISLLLANVCYGANYRYLIQKSLNEILFADKGYQFCFGPQPGEREIIDHINNLLNDCRERNLDYYFPYLKEQELVLYYVTPGLFGPSGEKHSITFYLSPQAAGKCGAESLPFGGFYTLYFVFDDSNKTGANLLKEEKKEKYCNLLLSHRESIAYTFSTLLSLKARFNDLTSELQRLRDIFSDDTKFQNWASSSGIVDVSDEKLAPLWKFLDNDMKTLMSQQNLASWFKSRPVSEIGIQLPQSYIANSFYYNFENFDNNNFDKHLDEINNALLKLSSMLTYINAGNGHLDTATKLMGDYASHLIYTEYGGKIKVTTVTVPIAVKPPGFFGKEFSEIKPETIFDKIKGFLFDLAPYVFTLLLIIGGLLYLLTPVSDQIKKGSEVIKWAVIGYFLLLVITGVVTLLKSVLGGP